MWGVKRGYWAWRFSVFITLRDSSSGIWAGLQEEFEVWNSLLYSHSTISPLRFFQYVQT